jgi:hypothetical protein
MNNDPFFCEASSLVHNHTKHHHCTPSHKDSVLTIRSHSGLSGDMFLAGLLCMTNLSSQSCDQLLTAIMPELSGSVRLVRKDINHIRGWHVIVDLPHQHRHRTLADILNIIEISDMHDHAKTLAGGTFALLAQAEGAVHGVSPLDVQFHEVGALDSILDICMTCELFTLLNPDHLVVSPLPMADGSIRCAHGIIPAPAPAVLQLMEGVPVCAFAGEGETVTPTAMALLKMLNASFGRWPDMLVEHSALVYGTREFPQIPNGAVFAFGTIFPHD